MQIIITRSRTANTFNSRVMEDDVICFVPRTSCVLSLIPLSAPSTQFFSLPPPDTINFKGARETR